MNEGTFDVICEKFGVREKYEKMGEKKGRRVDRA